MTDSDLLQKITELENSIPIKKTNTLLTERYSHLLCIKQVFDHAESKGNESIVITYPVQDENFYESILKKKGYSFEELISVEGGIQGGFKLKIVKVFLSLRLEEKISLLERRCEFKNPAPERSDRQDQPNKFPEIIFTSPSPFSSTFPSLDEISSSFGNPFGTAFGNA